MKALNEINIKQEQEEGDKESLFNSDFKTCSIKPKPIEKIYVKEEPLCHKRKEGHCLYFETSPLEEDGSDDCKAAIFQSTSGEACDSTANNLMKSDCDIKEVPKEPSKVVYECNECDFKSSQKPTLETHISKHTNQKLKCPDCRYTTNQRYILNQHVKIHSPIKPFKCFECDFVTHYKSSLKTHTLKHSGLKPFVCSDCHYVTHLKSNLNKHSRTHLNVKLYECSECVFSTKKKSSLKKHLRSHLDPYIITSQNHDIIEYKCSECEYVTYRRYALKTHLLKHPDRKHSQFMASGIDVGLLKREKCVGMSQ